MYIQKPMPIPIIYISCVLIFLTNFQPSNISCAFSPYGYVKFTFFKSFFHVWFSVLFEMSTTIFLFNVVTITVRKEIEVKNKLWFWLAISLSDWDRWLKLEYIVIPVYIMSWIKRDSIYTSRKFDLKLGLDLRNFDFFFFWVKPIQSI